LSRRQSNHFFKKTNKPICSPIFLIPIKKIGLMIIFYEWLVMVGIHCFQKIFGWMVALLCQWFSRPYGLIALNKNVIVADMFSLEWGVDGGGRRRLFA
jgi:hypothetical protein